MAEVATVARPYAEALFQSVGASADAGVWVQELAHIAADDELLQFADNPKTSAEQVMDVIQSVVRAQLPMEAVNFLRLVVENGRLPVMGEIAAQYRALSNQKAGVADAVVQSAFELSDAQLSDLSGVLEKRFSRRLNLSVNVKPELIGGIRVVVGDEVLDTSIKARLEQMKTALTA